MSGEMNGSSPGEQQYCFSVLFNLTGKFGSFSRSENDPGQGRKVKRGYHRSSFFSKIEKK
jgi:hypothetical protein